MRKKRKVFLCVTSESRLQWTVRTRRGECDGLGLMLISNRYESAADTGRSVAAAALQAIPVKTVARGKRCFDSPLVMQPQTEGRKNTREATQFTASILQFKLHCRHTNQHWLGLKESHWKAWRLRRERCGQSDVLSVRYRQIWLRPVGWLNCFPVSNLELIVHTWLKSKFTSRH